MGTFNWPPPGTSNGHQRGLFHGHGQARAWLTVIWHCWQDNLAYNPDKHRTLQRLLAEQNKINNTAA